jgi:predicted PhzF superfamily epimerase YddE/YHI9
MEFTRGAPSISIQNSLFCTSAGVNEDPVTGLQAAYFLLDSELNKKHIIASKDSRKDGMFQELLHF